MTKKKEKKLTKKQIIAELWRRGDLTYKFNSVQHELHEIFETDTRRILPILVSRRTGKTYYLLCRAIMKCIQKDYAVVKFLQPTQKELKKTCRHIMREILADCPDSLKPEWKENDKMYIFPNGSEIQLAGSDGKQYENLRGGSSDECIVDEAGFCDDLYDAVFSVLRPTTSTTKGKIFLASTPSKNCSHDFIQVFINKARNEGKLKVYTVYDNPMIDDEERLSIINDYIGGEENPEYRREYMCEVINDSEINVVAEWDEDTEKECVKDIIKPAFYDAYVSMDIGFKHLTVALFGYYDFLETKLVICDELVLSGHEVRSDYLATQIKEKEFENFKDNYNEAKKIYMRVADNNNQILLNDLSSMHNLHFLITAKDNKEAQINHLKLMIANKQIIISPKCKHLIYHLRAATWKTNNSNNRKEFNELPDLIDQKVKGGHADALDALIYLVRNLVKSHNPYPKNWNVSDPSNRFYNEVRNKEEDGLLDLVKSVLNLK